ncbi:hypothetical protein BE20_20180 [Sorangium cellulosum]|nr:hypothetical protein BE20_20180 [Sorangium cellulosum]
MNDHLIVICDGLVGLWAAYFASLEYPGHVTLLTWSPALGPMGGGYGRSARVCRMLHGGQELGDLVKEALDLWRGLPQEMFKPGLLTFGDRSYVEGPGGSYASAVAQMKRLGIAFQELDAATIQAKHNFKNLPAGFGGARNDVEGVVDVGVAAGLMTVNLRQRGAHQAIKEVKSIKALSGGVEITVVDEWGDTRTYTGSKCILAAETETNRLLGTIGVQLDLRIAAVESAWYRLTEAGKSRSGGAFFQLEGPTQGDHFFGAFYPENGAMCVHAYNPTSFFADTGAYAAWYGEEDGAPSPLQRFVEQRCTGVDTSPYGGDVYPETSASDNLPVIDFLPEVFPGHKNLVVAIAGSWHGFTSVFGKILVELAAKGSTTRDISRFRITRSGLLTRCPELPPVNSPEQKTIRDPGSGCRTEYSESESNKVNAVTALTMRRTSADPGNWHVTARIQGDAFHKTFLWWSAASHEFWIQGKVFRDGEQPTAMRSAGTPVWKDEVGGTTSSGSASREFTFKIPVNSGRYAWFWGYTRNQSDYRYANAVNVGGEVVFDSKVE